MSRKVAIDGGGDPRAGAGGGGEAGWMKGGWS
jgi:hypothetical protein